MSEHEVRALRRVYEAFSRWDVEELLSDLTHDVELDLPACVPFGGIRHGRDGVLAFATLFQDHVEGGWADPDDFLEAEDRIVVVGRIRGRGKETGREFEVPFVHIWTMADGVPSRCRSFLDTAPITAALRTVD